MSKRKKIIVGMSGGVDSSVAALLLQQQGHEVIGVYMKNWEDADTEETPEYRKAEALRGCSWEQDMADVRAVCAQLNIPYLTFNFVQEYRDLVFSEFVSELKAGRTPNPDIACNQEIKFRLFFEKALNMPDVDAVATGHYAAIHNGQLVRPADTNKDQTYFLHRIHPDHLDRILFPLQDLTKDEVRAIAAEHGFPNADKKDSTGICFIGDIDYNTFINEYIDKSPGEIQLQDGTVIGAHEGLHFYTIGQRRGINIGGDGPYYVVAKDLERGVLVVTNDSEDPALYRSECVVEKMHWLSETELPMQCKVQIRYRQPAQEAIVEEGEANNQVKIRFEQPQRAITPGQSAVIYGGDVVLGGGIIM